MSQSSDTHTVASGSDRKPRGQSAAPWVLLPSAVQSRLRRRSQVDPKGLVGKDQNSSTNLFSASIGFPSRLLFPRNWCPWPGVSIACTAESVKQTRPWTQAGDTRGSWLVLPNSGFVKLIQVHLWSTSVVVQQLPLRFEECIKWQFKSGLWQRTKTQI